MGERRHGDESPESQASFLSSPGPVPTVSRGLGAPGHVTGLGDLPLEASGAQSGFPQGQWGLEEQLGGA